MGKKYLLFITFLFFCFITKAQAPDWIWAKSAGGSNIDDARSICTDISGNIYITGEFSSPSITFGSTTLNNSSVNQYDLYIVKYDASGNVIWAKGAGGIYDDFGSSIYSDSGGNIYITGSFSGPAIVFDTITLNNLFSRANVFTVKINASGTAVWIKGGFSSENFSSTYSISNKVCVDMNGNVLLTGSFNSPYIVFDSDTLLNIDPNADWADIFFIKYDSLGNLLLAKSIGDVFQDDGEGIAVDTNGNIYLTGLFHGSSIILDTDTLESEGSADIFVAKYNATGDLLWAKSAGSTSFDVSNDIIVQPNGNIYFTGGFSTPSITFDDTTLIASGDGSMFIAKYDTYGNGLWAAKADDDAAGKNVIQDVNGSVYVIGYFLDSIYFGNYTLINASSSGNTQDIFIAKYDSSGMNIWAKSIGNISQDFGSDISCDADGNLFVTGYSYSSSLAFDNILLTNPAGDLPDIFVAKLDHVTGIETLETEKAISIYPNPAQNKLKITAEEKLTAYTITDISARVIRREVINNQNTFEIDITLLSSGIYYLKLETEKGFWVRKFVKE